MARSQRPTQVHLPYNFTARDYQSGFMRYYDRGGRNGFWLWHRRAGKDLVALHEEGKLAMKHVGMYWHCLPSYAQARKAIWNNFNNSTGQRLLTSVFPKEIIKSPTEFRPQGEMLIEFVNGSMLQLIGSDSIDNIVGAGPKHVTFSEFALCKPNSYDLIRPMLRESGGSVAFITTPRGKNHAWKIWEMAGETAGWKRDVRTLVDTGAWKNWRREDTGELFQSAEEVIQAEVLAGMQPEMARQEYHCDWTAALVGSIWGDLMETLEKTGRICNFDPNGRAVFVTYDLGKNDATAFWIWEVTPTGVNVIAHYENHAKGLAHYFNEQDAICQRLGLHLHTVWLPHDSTADTLVSDMSIEDQFIERFGYGKVKVVPRLAQLDGIQAGRWLLQQDIRFHKRCEATQGIEALKQYHNEYDEETRAYSNRPEHDWSSHCFTGDTEVLTRYGMCRMDSLAPTGEVMTPWGWSSYRSPRISGRNARVVAVRFQDGSQVRCTPGHLFATVGGWRSAESLLPGSEILSCSTDFISGSTGDCIGFSRPTDISGRQDGGCIERSGAALLGQCRQRATSIIGTVTAAITRSITWSVCLLKSTWRSAVPRGQRLGCSLERALRSGTVAPRGGRGTARRRAEVRAGPSGGVSEALASSAERSSRDLYVDQETVSASAVKIARPLRVESVVDLPGEHDVWDITVPDGQCFALSNGAVAHNSADAFRYLAVSVKLGKLLTKEKYVEGETPHGTSTGGVKTVHDFTMDELWSWREQDLKSQRRIM